MYTVVPINPKYKDVNGTKCYSTLMLCPHKIDTVTVYVRSHILLSCLDDIISTSPARVILNPETYSSKSLSALKESGIDIQIGCTLVMLTTGQF